MYFNYLILRFFSSIFYKFTKILKRHFKLLFIILLSLLLFFIFNKISFGATNIEFLYDNLVYHMTNNIPTEIYDYVINNTSFDPEFYDFYFYRIQPANYVGEVFDFRYFEKGFSNGLYVSSAPNSSYFRFTISPLDSNVTSITSTTVRFDNTFNYIRNWSVNTTTGQKNGYVESFDTSTRYFTVYFASSLPLYSNTALTDKIINGYPNETFNVPYIETSLSDMETFNYSYLKINGGDTPYSNIIGAGIIAECQVSLLYSYDGVVNTINVNNYITYDELNNRWRADIPRDVILSIVSPVTNTPFTFTLKYQLAGYDDYTAIYNGVFDITNLAQDIQSSINFNVGNINDSINDTTVDFSLSDLPEDITRDITEEGLNGIFTSIYNAFCDGQAQDIILPIPFTNKNITISADYVRSMLTSSNASWVISFIELFWWYLISRFIISDISKKITMIKSGDLENIQNSNIKEDML